MPLLPPVYINGKFYAGQLNGVHRAADRLIRELDRLLGDANPAGSSFTLVVPSGRKEDWVPMLGNIQVRHVQERASQVWEQWHLPRLAADGVLVSLANLAPVRHNRKVTLIHDCQFLFPDSSYPARQRLGYSYLMPHIARTSAAVLTVSDFSRRMMELLGVAPMERTQVLYNGVDHILETRGDPAALSDLGLASRGYALMFGSPKVYKNNAVVFAAYATGAIATPLVIVGASRLELEGEGLAPPPNTIFAGRCDDARLRALYEGALCLLCPSKTEGFGLPPLEAMACGTPAVISPAGAMPEVCRDAALYADIEDPRSWIDVITSLDVHSEAYLARAEYGRIRAGHFSWQSAGEKLLAVINDVAANAKGQLR